MKEKYMKIVGAVMPDRLVNILAEKAGQDKKKVENCCLEMIIRILGDGQDLTKSGIITRLKENVQGENLKAMLFRLEEKYGISPNESSVILGAIIPILFENLSKLDDSYYDQKVAQEPVIEKHEVKAIVQEEKDYIQSETEQMDQIFKNIEEKAEKQVIKNPQKEIVKKDKKPLFKFKKKEKKIKEIEIKPEPINEDKKELNLIEKICMIAVGVGFIALLGIIIFLFIKAII